MKDDIIWSLILKFKTKRTDNTLLTNFPESRMNLVCHFCGVNCDESTVNSMCLKNSNQRDNSNNINVPPEYLNNKRHYFIQAKENMMILEKMNITDDISEEYIMKVFTKMIKIAMKNEIELENLIQVNFKMANSVSKIRPVLMSQLELNEQEANSLITFFCFDTKSGNNEEAPLNLNGMMNFLQKAGKSVGVTIGSKKTLNPFENNILNDNSKGDIKKQSNSRYTGTPGIIFS